MHRPARRLFLACAAVVLATGAPAKDRGLDSREYKLMLRPQRFEGGSAARVEHFRQTALAPLIDAALGARRRGGSRAKGRFGPPDRVQVRFFDLDGCVLYRNGYVVRVRSSAPSEAELTLKFRDPRRERAASIDIDGRRNRGKRTKFEEDVTPRRSLFSLSTKAILKQGETVGTVRDLFGRFPTLGGNLARAGVDITGNPALKPGDPSVQVVFEGAKADLGQANARFSLTLVYPGEGADAGPPLAAELSFRLKHEGGTAAERRARDLYRALQAGLRDWIEPEAETKTDIGLEKVCGGAGPRRS